MKRAIVGFRLDADGDWVADLDCGHSQHARHQPPFVSRPWVTNEEGREAMLGRELDCPRCDRMEWPAGLEAHRRTPEFDERTIPAGLRSDHTTKRGTWARIRVLSGVLHYHVGAPIHRSFRIDTAHDAVVVPEVPHRVQPESSVRFFVEFYRVPKPQE